MVNGVTRACAEANGQVCAELPNEDRNSIDHKRDDVGHLRMSLYGSRDAAMNWQEEVAKEMAKWGFQRGCSNACLYWHKKTQ